MSSKQLIVNELLAFLVHAIDYMDEVSILQICRSHFKEDDISSGKLLLFQSLGKLDQMPSRRREGTEKSVQDIVDMLKKTDPDDVPDFVAKELSKLPPVTFDHVDVTRLLKDITTLKVEVTKMQSRLEASERTNTELRAEIALLRNVGSVIGSPEASKVNTRRESRNASIGNSESVNINASPAADNADQAPPAAAVARNCTPAARTSHVGASTPKRAYAAVVTTGKSDASKTKRLAKIGENQKKGTQPTPTAVRKSLPSMGQVDEEGFMKVEKKKKKKPCSRNQCGTALSGPNMLLRPAIPSTLLYISRLHHTTKTEEVVEYVRVKTNWTLRVERLESSHSVSFKSFVVRVPTHHLQTFLKEDFWPKGVMYRRFRGRLHDTTQRNTTPTTIRVS